MLTKNKSCLQRVRCKRQDFGTLYIFFHNTTKAHAYYKIVMLREALSKFGLEVI